MHVVRLVAGSIPGHDLCERYIHLRSTKTTVTDISSRVCHLTLLIDILLIFIYLQLVFAIFQFDELDF